MHCELRQGSLTLGQASEFHRDHDHLYIEAANLGELILRPWRDGDRIEPFGMRGQHKLISDLLTDAAVASDRKSFYPVLEYPRTGHILWVPGIRSAEETRRAKDFTAEGAIELSWRSSE
jgi:tRNA(Ile)-lysidine synthetase-like protein